MVNEIFYNYISDFFDGNEEELLCLHNDHADHDNYWEEE